MMEIKRMHWIGILIGVLVLVLSLFFIDHPAFYLVLGSGILIGAFPFVFTMIRETQISAEKEEMFLEFTRNLVESVKTGTPISRSILQVRDKPYGSLSENVRKLANQISLGIPLSAALQIFAKDVNNKTVSRALTLIGQAEKAGGDIGEILEAVAGAVSMSDKLKKERKAAMSTLIVQGYIIFIVFMVIILVMQFKILPMISGVGNIGSLGIVELGETLNPQEIASAFLYLLLIQGFFSGLVIGKLAEGNIKAGIKHSFALMLLSFLVAAVANLFMGGETIQIFLSLLT